MVHKEKAVKHLLVILALSISATGQAQAQKDSDRFRADLATTKSMQAAADTIPVGGDLPPISNAVVVVAGGLNGDPNRVIEVLIGNPRGQYYARGILADGNNTPIPLGAWEINGEQTNADFLVMSGNPILTFPSMSQIWKVEIIHFQSGLTEKLSVISGPYQDQANGLDVQLGGEQIVDGHYLVGLAGNATDVISVGISSYGLSSEIQRQPGGGAIAIFPQGFSPIGMTTFTVCKRNGWCYTDVFRSKLTPIPQKG